MAEPRDGCAALDLCMAATSSQQHEELSIIQRRGSNSAQCISMTRLLEATPQPHLNVFRFTSVCQSCHPTHVAYLGTHSDFSRPSCRGFFRSVPGVNTRGQLSHYHQLPCDPLGMYSLCHGSVGRNALSTRIVEILHAARNPPCSLCPRSPRCFPILLLVKNSPCGGCKGGVHSLGFLESRSEFKLPTPGGRV
jgi:hypothetical protein